jgi:hypothetical protein
MVRKKLRHRRVAVRKHTPRDCARQFKPDCSLALADRNTGAFLLSLDCHKRLLSTSRMKLTLPPARFADGAQRVCRPDPQRAHRNQERESACAEGVIP